MADVAKDDDFALMECILKARKALLPGNLILIVLIKTFIYKSNQFNF